MRTIALALLAGGAMLALLAATADAQADIGTAAGPVFHAWIGDDLRCQAEHGTDALSEFYPDDATQGDCATWVAVGDVGGGTPMLYGPDFSGVVPATTIGPSSAGGPLGIYTLYSLVSQSAVTGAGTSGSPMSVTTVVRAGDIEITQVDSYVTGNDWYDTSITVRNTGTVTKLVVVYRAGNCMTPTGDTPAYGWLDLGLGEAGCADNANDTPTAGVSGFVALPSSGSPSAKIAEGFYGNIWSVLRVRTDFNDLCVCASSGNHGAGIDWRLGLGPAGSRTLLSQTLFLRAATGPPNDPPTVSPVADATQVTCATPGVLFDARALDLDGTIVAVAWDFGDGIGTSNLPNPSYPYANAGTYTATVTASDDRGASATGSVVVTTVGDSNCCPAIGVLAGRHTIEGRTVRFLVRATDGDRDPLSFAVEFVGNETPALATMQTASGWFEWPTRPGDAGTYQLRVTVDDGQCIDERKVALTIDPVGGADASDEDRDGVSNDQDNCPSVPNLDQADADQDGQGDLCDEGDASAPTGPPAGPLPSVPGFDLDGDGVADVADRCPEHPDPDQADLDSDFTGDACDKDLDGDGVAQAAAEWPDNCPRLANPDQADVDGDGVGDACKPVVASRPQVQDEQAIGTAAPTGPDGLVVAAVAGGATLALAAVVGAVLVLRLGKRRDG